MLGFTLEPSDPLSRSAIAGERNRASSSIAEGGHVLGAMSIKRAPGKCIPHYRLNCRNTGPARQHRFYLFTFGVGANATLWPFSENGRLHNHYDSQKACTFEALCIEASSQMKKGSLFFLIAVAAAFYRPLPAWTWGNDGHEIVAIIAADNLTPTARAHVAQILGVSSDAVATAMASASVRPDTEFRIEDRSTAPWHFIDICLQDQKSDMPARCPKGNCVTAKVDEYAKRLKDGNYDGWGPAGDLAFLIHFVGDIHQPLHTATDADLGGNCIQVESHPRARNLHMAWDDAIVYRLEDTLDSGNPKATAVKLEQMYASQKAADTWKPGATNDIAWESHEVAVSQIYEALKIPIEPCTPDVHSCAGAPPSPVVLDDSYMNGASTVAGQQLAKAGFRLASLLNGAWPQ